jgi:hypothetical protein
MAELVTGIARYAVWLYLLLGLLMLRELRVMWRAGTDRDRSAFGLEREAATGRAVRSLITLFLLVTIAAGVYTVATIIAPTLPDAALERMTQAPIVVEPPPVPLATDTPVPPAATGTSRLPNIVTATPGPAGSPAPTAQPALCRNAAVLIEAPGPGTVLGPTQPVVVTVRFPRGQGRHFQLSLGAGDDPTTWSALGAQHAEPVTGGAVEMLPTDGLAAGDYTLRLELLDADGTAPDENACRVVVRVP